MSETVRVKTQRGKRPPPEGVNFVMFTQVGADVQMLTVYADLDDLREGILSEGDLDEVVGEITHRFSMSVTGFFRLRDQVNDLVEKMKAAGAQIPDHDSGAEEAGDNDGGAQG